MLRVSFDLNQRNFVPYTEEVVNTIIKDAFRMYDSLDPDSIHIEDLTETESLSYITIIVNGREKKIRG